LPDWLLRAPAPSEAETLGRIGFDAWELSAFGDDDQGRADRTALLEEFVAFCRDQRDTMLIAELDGKPAGWGAREYLNEVVSDLWVAPWAQKRGVGAALLEALEIAIAKGGFAHAELETYAGNVGAVRFYMRQGYTPIWRGMKHSPSLNYALDKVRLRKPLLQAVQT